MQSVAQAQTRSADEGGDVISRRAWNATAKARQRAGRRPGKGEKERIEGHTNGKSQTQETVDPGVLGR